QVEQLAVLDDVDRSLRQPPAVEPDERAQELLRPAAVHEEVVVPEPGDALLPPVREVRPRDIAHDFLDGPHAKARVQVGDGAEATRERTTARRLEDARHEEAPLEEVVARRRQPLERARLAAVNALELAPRRVLE